MVVGRHEMAAGPDHFTPFASQRISVRSHHKLPF